jgi:hypothetical protein
MCVVALDSFEELLAKLDEEDREKLQRGSGAAAVSGGCCVLLALTGHVCVVTRAQDGAAEAGARGAARWRTLGSVAGRWARTEPGGWGVKEARGKGGLATGTRDARDAALSGNYSRQTIRLRC